MRLLTIVTPLVLCVLEAAGAAVNLAGGLSQSDLLQELTDNSNLLPKSSRQVLSARVQQNGLSKRAPQRDKPVKDDNLNAILSSILGAVQNLDKAAPRSKVKRIQDSPSPSWPGAKRRKIRYGPYRIPPTSEDNLESQLLKKKGLTNTMSLGARKPCIDDCIVLSLAASIEYDDGRTADVKSGAWLHHAVLLNIGPQDPVCGGPIEHLFEAGNERTDIDFALHDGSIKSGYHIRNSDTFLINTELMNMDDREKWVWLQLTFDYIDGFDPAYKDGKVIWMSIGPARCGGKIDNPFGPSNLTISQKPTQTAFVEYSIPWKARKNGYILGTNSHLHDGGLKADIYLNANVFCSSSPHYSESISGGMGGMGGMSRRSIGGGGGEMRGQIARARRQAKKPSLHIDSQTGCEYPGKEIPIKQGDSMYLRVDYDFSKYPGMRDSNGEMEEIMGMTGTLVAFDFP